MFAFPRAIVVKGFEHELFVPYTKLFSSKDKGLVVQALAKSISPTHVTLDRSVTDIAPSMTNEIPYDYLIYAAGASHPEPTSLCDLDTKEEGVSKLRYYQDLIEKSTKVLVCGGGAAGLETASEIKEHYPDKEVTLVHSRERYMLTYNYGLHKKAYKIVKDYGVKQILGERVIIPKGGFEHDGLMCTGLTPNSSVLSTLSPSSIDPTTSYVLVHPTLQIHDTAFPNVFAGGDVTSTTDIKTAHSAWYHGFTCIENIVRLIKGDKDLKSRPKSLPQIFLYLGCSLGMDVHVGNVVGEEALFENVGAERAWVWLQTPIAEAKKV
ncbi:hypothetical protein BC829DRAFT_425863 [Chytridium lagenaria]|nr:hypothetical protein BC829DRAFT_425863 [Chytridium lagenaria]